MTEQLKSVGDGAALVVTTATFIEWMPAIAALASFVWVCIRIWETRTVQRMCRGVLPKRVRLPKNPNPPAKR